MCYNFITNILLCDINFKVVIEMGEKLIGKDREKVLEKYCFDLLMDPVNTVKPDDIITSNLEVFDIFRHAQNYAINAGVDSDSFEKIKNSVKGTIWRTVVYNNRGENYFNEDRVSEACYLIGEAVKNYDSIDSVCDDYGLSMADFEELANVLKYNDSKLYASFKKKFKIKPKKSKVKFTSEELALQKYCYDLLENSNWSTSKLCTSGISIPQIRLNAKNYAVNTLGYTDSEFYYQKFILGSENGIKNTVNSKRGYVFFEELSDASSNDDYIKICNKYFSNVKGRPLQNYKLRATDYVVKFRNSEKDYLVPELKDKMQVYFDFISKENSDLRKKEFAEKKEKTLYEETIPSAQELFNGFLIDPDYINSYLNHHGVGSQKHKKFLRTIEEYDPELYIEVMEKYNEAHSILLLIAKDLVNKIEAGVDEGGKLRKFDMFDYYQYTHIDPEKLIADVIKDLTASEMRLIRSAVGNREYIVSTSVLKLMRSDYQLQVDGGVRFATEEEKEKVYEYFVSHDLPFYTKLFVQALRRCMDGKLDRDDNINDNINDNHYGKSR